LAGAIDYAFQTARVAYNASHPDQIDLVEEKDGEAAVKSLVGDKTFPAGIQPAFALKEGFLLIAGNTNAIQRFRKPTALKEKPVEVPLFRFSAAATRAYLETHRGPLSTYLASKSTQSAGEIARQIHDLTDLLEPTERIDAFVRPVDQGVQLAVGFKMAKKMMK
jgi:hypothetical protein